MTENPTDHVGTNQQAEQVAPVDQTRRVDVAAYAVAVRRDALKGKRRLASSVLAMEVVVFWLAIIVAVVSSHVAAGVAVPVGVALALACVAVAAFIKRRWAFWAGGVLQIIAIGCGFAVPAMFVIGSVFALLWYAAIRVGDSAVKVADRYAASIASGDSSVDQRWVDHR